ncbi:MAG: efflux RND transporter permease subunit [Marinosulfonomonas sp.]|nr:efflux RND transporter permease subunit [Marinosulfonomonas sp.]
MTGIVDWAAGRARMVLAFIVLSLIAGSMAYAILPKEGEPDIEIPMVIISVPFPGISASDAEKLLVKPMETELSDLDGLKTMSTTAAENYAVTILEFDFGWDKSQIIADVRDRMSTVEAQFPAGADKYVISEFNFSEFPIIIVNLTGDLPERTLLRVAKDLQDRLEELEPVLEAALTGHRDEMVEVVIDPLRLEAYNVTALDLINVVVNNNQLIAAGEIETATGAFSVKIPSSFDEVQDIYNLPVKINGDRVVTLGDLADIRLTFKDRTGIARYNGDNTVALQVSKRKGFNIIDTSDLVREVVAREAALWPEELQAAINIGTSNDQSRIVGSMVRQLEGSVLTAIALVMIVVLATLGTRSALLVGFAIPTSFLLCFVLLAIMGIAVSNIVMFGLILAVGMLVDGAIVVVEYADRRIREGTGPMHAYVEAAKRMFWPIVSSTATTLCAFLPMLFWPGVPGQFMGMLPVTLIFVLSASLVVALVYLPVMGGVTGRLARSFGAASDVLRPLPWIIRAALAVGALFLVFVGAMQGLNPDYIPPLGAVIAGVKENTSGIITVLVVFVLQSAPFLIAAVLASITVGAAKFERKAKRVRAGYHRSLFGWLIRFVTGNPIMPLVTIGLVISFVVMVFGIFAANNNGTEFFVESEPEQAIVFVRQRGNLSLIEKDAAVRQVEQVILATEGIQSAFAFAGEGGLKQNDSGAGSPRDTIGRVQIELIPWDDRSEIAELDGDLVLERLKAELAKIPGIRTEILNLSRGPASGKPVHIRLKGNDWAALNQAATIVRARFDTTVGLTDVEDTLPLPGFDQQIDVDVEKAGRFGADVRTVGGMVQLVTRGILLDTMRVDTSDEEIEIRVRLPKQDRVLSTLDSLRVRTEDGLIPLSYFITRKPVQKLGQIDRVDQRRYFDVKAALIDGLTKVVTNDSGEVSEVPITANERIETLTTWLETEKPLPAGVNWEWTGDNEEEAETGAFLGKAFLGALGLMFIILLAQFNSFYNSVLVLLAVILSTTGVLIGMLVMDQAFSMIMTGTGVVALAGIVVNNNIVLIDTYQEYSKFMPRLEAISRTAQDRLRPVLLTTVTTMAGLSPMMFGLSLDFFNGGFTIDSPTALWWKQLATAIVFGLGIATVLTLVFTPSMLALRVWVTAGAYRSIKGLKALSLGRDSLEARDIALMRASRKLQSPELIWGADLIDAPIAAELLEDDVDGGNEDTEVKLADLELVLAKTAPKKKPRKKPAAKKPKAKGKTPPLRAAE